MSKPPQRKGFSNATDASDDSEIASPTPPGFVDAKWYAIVTNGGVVACRFGPFGHDDAERLSRVAAAQNIPLMLTADCGPMFDWELAGAWRYTPQEIQAAAAAHARRGKLRELVLHTVADDNAVDRLFAGMADHMRDALAPFNAGDADSVNEAPADTPAPAASTDQKS